MQRSALALAFLGASVGAIKVDFDSDASIKSGASTIAYGLMKYYNGNETGEIPGVLPEPYYWWESGALFETLIDYWVQTGDDTYNAVTTQGLLHQVGAEDDFFPANQSLTIGNDDQGVWALAAIAAAENGLPGPSKGSPQWLDLAKNVFNDFVARWDTKYCGGGLRWQVLPFNAGYDYKNSISNAVFFDLAARLYQQTNNQTYSQWATKVFEWEQKAGLITDSYQVFQGVSTEDCDKVNKVQFSMEAGIFLHGSAAMYNATTSAGWKTRLDGLVKSAQTTFFKDSVLFEQACEGNKLCGRDQQVYKGFLVRALKSTTQLAPYTISTIQPLLQSTAKAAATSCAGSPSKGFAGQPGTACGYSWVGSSAFDGVIGVGEQLNALSAVASAFSKDVKGSGNNGTSTGGSTQPSGTGADKPSTTPKNSGNKIGASAMTALVVLGGIMYGLC
ncbi:glycosyl hydrolase family 76 [Trichoderma arundinaceum]|uniref:Mannan endo-1,6-alpha-mannosidase n=1 Tax=Trichoderma arundinaceum TaxID=490622 RepID=A0A395NR80_TRIAR|nr:glycosyl hydrolase family 76 [Trichoderma arundinaceum]